MIDLPRRVSMPIEVCLSIADSDPELPLLPDSGWRLVSPRERVSDANSYRQYIQRFRGEFIPVRPICSLGQSGWEDTGLGLLVPVGQGLLTYTDVDSASQPWRASSVEISVLGDAR